MEEVSIKNLAFGAKIYDKKRGTEGTRTCVYIGKIKNGDQVAIKVYRKNKISEEDLNQFVSESKFTEWASQTSSEVIKYYGAFSDGNAYFIVVEDLLCTVEKILINLATSNQVLTDAEVIYSMNKLLIAFASLSKQGIFHCNINTSNIMIDKDNMLKIIDFSKADQQPDPESEINLITEGKDLDYLSPELIEILEFNSNASRIKYQLEKNDVFSLGLVFLRMATLKDICGLNKSNDLLWSAIDKISNKFIKSILENMLCDEKNRLSFNSLLEFFTGKPIEYPIGEINEKLVTSLSMRIKYPDGILEYSGFINDCKVIIKFFQANHDDHQEKCRYYVNSILNVSGKTENFLLFYGAFNFEEYIWVVHEDYGTSIESIRTSRVSSYDVFSESELASYFKSLLRSLNYCHINYIYLNNIKPSTIYITSGNVIKFDSFSIPFCLRKANLNQTVSALKKDQVNDEDNYLAPEIVANLHLISLEEKAGFWYEKGLADVYSLGLVFYEMITLQKAVQFNFRKNSVSTEAKINLVMVEWQQKLLKKMLVHDPKLRSTAAELIDMIPNM